MIRPDYYLKASRRLIFGTTSFYALITARAAQAPCAVPRPPHGLMLGSLSMRFSNSGKTCVRLPSFSVPSTRSGQSCGACHASLRLRDFEEIHTAHDMTLLACSADLLRLTYHPAELVRSLDSSHARSCDLLLAGIDHPSASGHD